GFADNRCVLIDETNGAVVEGVDDCTGIDPKQMVKRGAEAFNFVEGVGDVLALAVCRPDDTAAPEATAGAESELSVIPVIAASARAGAALRLAAHFAQGENDGRVEQAALVEVFQERGQSDIEHRNLL